MKFLKFSLYFVAFNGKLAFINTWTYDKIKISNSETHLCGKRLSTRTSITNSFEIYHDLRSKNILSHNMTNNTKATNLITCGCRLTLLCKIKTLVFTKLVTCIELNSIFYDTEELLAYFTQIIVDWFHKHTERRFLSFNANFRYCFYTYHIDQYNLILLKVHRKACTADFYTYKYTSKN